MSSTPLPLVIGWKLASLEFKMASVRYRAMLPLLALESHGSTCRVFSSLNHAQLDTLGLLVIVKSFTTEDLALMQLARARGVPVLLDLCDNIFVPKYGVVSHELKTSPSQIFLAMARIAQGIVVTTEPLALAVRAHLDVPTPVHVVPDGLETPELLAQMRHRLSQALASQQPSLKQTSLVSVFRRQGALLSRHVNSFRTAAKVPMAKRLARRGLRELHWRPWAKRAYRHFDNFRRRMLATAVKSAVRSFVAAAALPVFDPDLKRILWFGNHGAPYARFGIGDLLEIREPLEAIAREFKVELVVVSNRVTSYERLIKPLAIPSRFVEWSAQSLARELAAASVVVVPNSRDAFSVCKSANRTATALMAGVPVAATATSALDALRDCVVLDDFPHGLRLYLTDRARATFDVAKGRRIIETEFGQAATAAAWNRVIDRTMAAPQGATMDAALVVGLNLIQDLDLVLPIMLHALRVNISVVACCSTALVKKSPRLASTLNAHAIQLVVLADDYHLRGSFKFPPSAKILLTATESNLGPHRFTRRLTDAANAQNLFTATLQHGFENSGLTYEDEAHVAAKITFSSQRIYLWGGLDTLHTNVRMATRSKCVPIGCPKPAGVAKANLSDQLPPDRTVIGVFENLHWERYSDAYRAFFLDGVQRMAIEFPDLIFLVKPHHAGMWLTAKFIGDAPRADNMVIADPKSPLWEPHTAPSLMGNLHAVITSPSTVALDASRAGLPVAIVAHELELPNYEPLPLIRTAPDWAEFVRSSLHPSSTVAGLQRARRFLSRTLLPDGAEARIVSDMVETIGA